MSATIDQRIVEMRFDNSQFERNVSTTMSTLDKLKQNLNMSDASRGLENVNRAARNVNMSGLSNAVETVHAKFSALEIMGITALTNITNSAVNAGKKIVSALTIDPIKTGFQEYETQINSVQTILANTSSKGTTLDDVNQALDELNKYADMTIYNFTQMTKNIGTFTAAGVDLDTSVSAIKGIANLAAVSGSTSQQASTAMYQLSQALATGTVRLQDWNSVVNAGMGGEVFQNALKRTATVMGTDVDALIKKYGSFRESLTRGEWLTTDVLNETLKQFTMAAKEGTKQWEEYKQSLKEQGYTEEQAIEILKMANTATDAATKVKTFTQLWDTLKETAQSGWTQTWELVIGDFEEAKELLTKVSDVLGGAINSMSDARNSLLGGALTSKWDQLTAKVEAAGISTEDFQSKLKEVAKEHNIAVDDLIEEYGSLGKAVSAGKIPTDVIKETIKKLVGVSDAAGVAAGKTEEYGEIVKRVINGEFGTGKDRMEALTKAGYDYATVQNLVNEKLGASAKHLSELSDEQLKNTEQLSKLSDEQLKNKGYTEEQITALRELQKAAEEGGTSIDDLMSELTKPSGRELLIESLSNAFGSLITIFKSVRDAWKEIFPPMTSDQLYSIIEAIHNFSKQLVIGEETADKLKRTFKGVFAVLDIFKQAITTVLSALGVVPSLFGVVTDLGGGVLDLTASWGDWLVKLNETVKASGIFTTASQAITTVLTNIIQCIKGGIEYVKSFMTQIKENVKFPGMELFHSLLGEVQKRLTVFTTSYSNTKDVIASISNALGVSLENNKIIKVLTAIWTGVTQITSCIIDVLGKFMNGALTKIANFDYSGIFDFVNTLSVSSIGVLLTKLMSSITGVVLAIKGIAAPLTSLVSSVSSITGILNSVRGCFEAYQKQLKADALIKIAAAIGILAASILVISFIDSGKLAASLAAITTLFGDLMGSMFLIGKISSIKDAIKTIAMMQGMSISILILAAALRTVATLEISEIATGLLGIVGITGTLVGAMVLLSKFAKKAVKGAIQMVIFAAAIKVLASTCKDLSTLSWEQLAKGLLGVGILLAEVSLFLRTAKFSGKSITTATGIVILAGAIKILASACKDFGQMPIKEIGKGLVAIGVLLAEVAGFTKLTGNAKNVISTGIALIAIAGAMKIFASAMSDFGIMKWETIGKGLAAMAGSLLLVTAAVRLMPSNMIGTSVGLIAIGAALLIVAEVMKNMGGMQWDAIGRGLVVLGGSLGIIAIAVNAMRGALAGVAALVVVVGALALLTPVLSILGAMPIANIGKALLTLAATFAVIGVAGLLLKPVVTTLLSFGATIALVGVGVALIGAGLLAAGAGLSAIAIGFTALVGAIAGGAAAIVASLTVIITGILSLVPTILTIIGDTLVGICQVIINAAPVIFEAVGVVITSLISMLVTIVPTLADGLLQIITGVMAAAATYVPQIVDSILQLIINVIDALAARLPELIVSVVNLFVSFFQGIVDAFASVDPSSLTKALEGLGILAAMFGIFAGLAALAPMAMAGVLAMGVVIVELSAVLAAIGAIAQIPGLDWLIGEGGQLLQTIGTAIGQFVGGLVGGFASGVTAQFPQIGTDLSSFMTNLAPFIEGAKNIDSASMEAVKTLAETILVLTGANILEGITSFITGGSSLSSFGAELAAFAPYFNQYYQEIKGIDATVITASSNAALALAEMASKLPNSGGLAGWFSGENDMTTFGNQLIPFGASMLAYSLAVAGIDANAVTNSATAALSLAEMASKLPNSGGLAGWFSGENDMATFGQQLVPFGAGMLAYSLAVAGMDTNAITNSATAALALAELANKLPNSGGLVSWFAGENDMSTFGSQLKPFGEGIKAYADSITGMDSEAVANSATAALALAELANNLPNSGGLGSLFTGDNDISSFGTKLVPFGQGMKAYSDSVAGINGPAITSSVKATNDLVGVLKSMSGIDTSGVNSFKKAIDSLSKTNISGFINTFSASSDKLKSVGIDMIKYIAEGLKAKATSLDSVAIDIADRLSNSIKSRKTVITNTMTEIVTSMTTTITNKKQVFTTSGTEAINAFSQGITTNKAKVSSTITPVLDSAVTSMKGYYFKFQDAGKHLVNGFVNGINTNMYKASAKAKAMAKAAKEAAEKELGIQSPSKEFKEIGEYTGEGFAIGMDDSTNVVSGSAEDMAQTVKDTVLDTIDNGDINVAGELVGEHLSTGMEDSTELVTESSTELAEVVTETVSETIADGKGDVSEAVNETVVDGITDNTEAAEKASENIAKSATQSALEAIKSGDKEIIKEVDGHWSKLLAAQKKGEDKKKYKDMKLVEFEKQILEETKNIWSDYITELSSTSNSIMGEANLFSDMERYEEQLDVLREKVSKLKPGTDEYKEAMSELNEKIITKDEMTGYLEEQVLAYKDYAETIATLNARISNSNLKDAINKMGVDSTYQLKVLNSMTDEELSNYAALYDVKFAYATNAAATQLNKLQTETETKLSSLYGGVEVDAIEFGKTFDGSMESIEAYVVSAINPERFKMAGSNITEGIGQGMSSSKAGEKAAEQTIDDIEEAAKKAAEIHSPSQLFKREVGANIIAGMANGILDNTSEVTNASSLTISGALSELTSAYDRFYGAGEYLVGGFVNGISANINSAASKATAMADAAAKAAKKALSIHSPSRVFYEIGAYTGQGFVNALHDYGNQAYKSGSGIAEQARKGMNAVVNKINDAINGDMDVQPTIRPLMDLSNIESGASAIANMFNSRHSIGVLSSVGAINSMMNQNGVNGESEIVSAIDKLRKDISNIGGPSYSIDKITYDDGSNIADAMKSIVRAATIERRK